MSVDTVFPLMTETSGLDGTARAERLMKWQKSLTSALFLEAVADDIYNYLRPLQAHTHLLLAVNHPSSINTSSYHLRCPT